MDQRLAAAFKGDVSMSRGAGMDMDMVPYRDSWTAEDPHANFKAEVAAYTAADPLPTLERLSAETGIPVPCLARYVLVKWTASGAEALLAMGPVVFEQMRQHV